MTPDSSNYHGKYSPDGSYSLFQFERCDVISVLKNSVKYSFAFFKCLQVGIVLWESSLMDMKRNR